MQVLPNENYLLKENETGGKAKNDCVFSFALSADAFTFFYEVTDGDVYCPYTRDNENLYDADAVEVFISPDGKDAEYYELEISPEGARFFAKVKNALDGVPTITLKMLPPAFTAETERSDSGYRAKVTLPYKAMDGFDPDHCRLNAFRLDYDRDGFRKELQALNPTLCNRFHFPAFFVPVAAANKENR